MDFSGTDWSSLSHCFGSATDVPEKLAELYARQTPNAGADDELWEWILTTLVHQGVVYSATLAATPYLMDICESKAPLLQFDFVWFVGWVEHCRQLRGFQLPADLKHPHLDALHRCEGIAIALLARDWDEYRLAGLFQTISTCKGLTRLSRQLCLLDCIPEEDLAI